MKLGNFDVVKSEAISFDLKIKRVNYEVPIYHWLWFTFSFYNKNAYKIKCLEKRIEFNERRIALNQNIIARYMEKEMKEQER